MCRGQAALGRDFAGQRYGPRPVDLDIIFYDDVELEDQDLIIPHARWHERAFVQAPVNDLYAPAEVPNWHEYHEAQGVWQHCGGVNGAGQRSHAHYELFTVIILGATVIILTAAWHFTILSD